MSILLKFFQPLCMQKKKFFVRNLLHWYDRNKRDLPWRETKNPYEIWLSEVILQQTRIKQGLPYFTLFLKNYPNIQQLAEADEQEVLRHWQGLGYYSRAKNLHACAKKIVAESEGNFPRSYSELLKLKGIGKYTAAAIASFAFGEKVAVVDGNVYRVLSRVFGVLDDITSSSGQKRFQEIANAIIPDEDSMTYNQAIMEFGALHCTPRQPLCEQCPCKEFCYAKLHEVQDSLPVKSKKVKVKNRYFNYFVFRHQGELLMKERVEKDIWHGLYDFVLLESKAETAFEQLNDPLIEKLRAGKAVVYDAESYKHILTHQRLYINFFLVELLGKAPLKEIMRDYNLRKFTFEQVKKLPKPILIDKYLSKNIF